MVPLNRGRSRCCNYGVLALVPLKRGRSRCCNYGALAILLHITLQTHFPKTLYIPCLSAIWFYIKRSPHTSNLKALQTRIYNVIMYASLFTMMRIPFLIMVPLKRGRSRCCNYKSLAIMPLKRGSSRRCNYGALAIFLNITLYTHLFWNVVHPLLKGYRCLHIALYIYVFF